MFGLGNLLFGKKVTVNTQLGTFKARVRNNSSKEIIWTGEIEFTTQNSELILMLLGNAKGPFQSQLETAQSILKDEESIKIQIVELLSGIPSDMKKIQDLKITDFRLKYIGFFQDDGITHELSYESEDGGYFGAVFKGQAIKDLLI
ncbi:hypothetical protein [uncultured Kordia sp.]|uniref:hypothetical protein n=1 Tax=uncultured Kordia sp. TaxID=507699 RepID=UPI002636385E|nr:hypothetical protein [uncultured Kordia sp.]